MTSCSPKFTNTASPPGTTVPTPVLPLSRLANVCGMFNRLKCNLLLLEYRGFGFSSGSPSEWGLYQDAAASLAYLHTRQDIDNTKIVVFGRSLGECLT